MCLKTDIKQFIADNKQDAVSFVKTFQATKDLVLYGETHVGLEKKARFFARLINASHMRYHASEHFNNTETYGEKVAQYLEGKITKLGLPSDIRPLTVVLDAIKVDVSNRGIVFAGTTAKSGSTHRRHERIHHHFTSSFGLHIKAGRFKKTDKGHFHIGAFHASRLPQIGSTKTTTQRLIADGFNCGVVRIMVDVSGSFSEANDNGGTVITAGEMDWVEPIAGGDIFELVPLLREMAGGNAFGLDLQIRGTPFLKIKRAGLTSSNSFSHYYDKLVYLP